MTLEAVTFDRMPVTAADDALINTNGLTLDRIVSGYRSELAYNYSGLTATINPGAAVIQGRLVKINAPMRLTLPANSKGYIVIEIDTGKINTSTGTPGTPDYKPVNNQVSLKWVSDIVQQDINDSGSIYMFPIVEFTTNASNTTLIEYKQPHGGSTSRGSYIRYPDGTLICYIGNIECTTSCTIQAGSVYRTASQAWVFPVSFKYVPAVTSSISGNLGYGWSGLGDAANGNTQASFVAYSPTSSSAKPKLALIAIGRWK